MANTRELSQLASLINVIDENKSIGVVTEYPNANVGIGTLSPAAKVDVVGDAFVSGIVSATSFYGDGSNLTNLQTASSGIGIQSSNTVIGTGITTLNFIGTGNTFSVNGNIVDINISGNSGSVSIGTIAPTSPSEGDLWYSPDYARTFVYYTDSNSSQWIDAAPFSIGVTTSNDGASVTISTTTPSNPNSGDLWYNPNYGRTFIYYEDVDSSQWVDSSPFYIGISTSSQGLVGTPDINVGHIESESLNVSGIITCSSLVETSDIKLKENIKTVDNSVKKLNQLRGVKFDWKNSGNSSYGVIAQELEKIVPELVYGEDIKSVNYSGIIAFLIEAFKEQQKEIENLKSRIDFLEG